MTEPSPKPEDFRILYLFSGAKRRGGLADEVYKGAKKAGFVVVVEEVDEYGVDDAQVLLVTCGIAARAAKSSLTLLERAGVAAGLFRPVTLWPFPEESFKRAAAGKQLILVPEMNAGQLIHEIQRVAPPDVPVAGLNRIDGEAITPQQIADRVQELLKDV